MILPHSELEVTKQKKWDILHVPFCQPWIDEHATRGLHTMDSMVYNHATFKGWSCQAKRRNALHISFCQPCLYNETVTQIEDHQPQALKLHHSESRSLQG